MKAVAGAGAARTTENYTQAIPQDFARGIHPQFAPGGNNQFGQDSEPAKFSQRQTEINLFSDKDVLIKAADGIEIFARCEKKRARAQVEGEVEYAKDF